MSGDQKDFKPNTKFNRRGEKRGQWELRKNKVI